MGPCTNCVLIPCAAETVWIAGGRLWLTEILRIQERFPCNSLAKKLTPLIFPNSAQVPSSATRHPWRRQAKVEEREESSFVPPNFPFNGGELSHITHPLVHMAFFIVAHLHMWYNGDHHGLLLPGVLYNSLENTEPALALPVFSGIILHNPLLKNDGFSCSHFETWIFYNDWNNHSKFQGWPRSSKWSDHVSSHETFGKSPRKRGKCINFMF